ncbi:hypothetical protein [Qiania dongpingensis]|uniref:Uncharacterized protein n=1 Tax=Qiania dongpingensis TaxID=2763669 RepID=A0A7G9G3G5_9FIRM|nr:hypothetical protein [Qiania dongpingensis]QNM05347.1 hypothetical protein H9Q78_13055 [Qiania dongpingensis]
MIYDFCLPTAGKILLTPLRRSPYDGIGSFLLLLFPHHDKLPVVLKTIEAATVARCGTRAGRADTWYFYEIRKMEVIRNGAADRTPAERFRTGLKVSAAGQRPVFPRWRKTETKDTDSVSERTGDGKSCGFPADM